MYDYLATTLHPRCLLGSKYSYAAEVKEYDVP